MKAYQYIRKDTINRKDVTVYIQNIIKIIKDLKWNTQNNLITAFYYFEADLQRDLDPSDKNLTLFIKQMQLRQKIWYQIYVDYDKPRPSDPMRPPYRPPQQPPHRPPIRSPYPQQPHASQQTRLQPVTASSSTQPRVYWAEKEKDWEYDTLTNNYHITHRPPSHTPHRYDNTHDDNGTETITNWTNTDEKHRCNHKSYTHYHWEGILQNKPIQLIKRLNSSRNHIKFIDKGRISIYNKTLINTEITSLFFTIPHQNITQFCKDLVFQLVFSPEYIPYAKEMEATNQR